MTERNNSTTLSNGSQLETFGQGCHCVVCEPTPQQSLGSRIKAFVNSIFDSITNLFSPKMESNFFEGRTVEVQTYNQTANRKKPTGTFTMPKYVGQYSFIPKILSPVSPPPQPKEPVFIPQIRKQWPPRGYAEIKEYYENESYFEPENEDLREDKTEELPPAIYVPSEKISALKKTQTPPSTSIEVESDNDMEYFECESEDTREDKTEELPPSIYIPIFEKAISLKEELIDLPPSSKTEEVPLNKQSAPSNATKSSPPSPNATRAPTPPSNETASPPQLPDHLVIFHGMLAGIFSSVGRVLDEKISLNIIQALHLDKTIACEQKVKDGNIQYIFDFGSPLEGFTKVPILGECNVTIGPKMSITLDLKNKSITFDPNGALRKPGLSLTSIKFHPQIKKETNVFEVQTSQWGINQLIPYIPVTDFIEQFRPDLIQIKKK